MFQSKCWLRLWTHFEIQIGKGLLPFDVTVGYIHFLIAIGSIEACFFKTNKKGDSSKIGTRDLCNHITLITHIPTCLPYLIIKNQVVPAYT
jgi:hypothetical protein